jgi:hypothetical protein
MTFLSDELLRLRNIKRNEARLAKLGLAQGIEKSKSSDNQKSKSKKEGAKKSAVDTEKRSVPPRHKKNDRQESATVKEPRQSNDDGEKTKKRKNKNETTTNTTAKRSKSSNDDVTKAEKSVSGSSVASSKPSVAEPRHSTSYESSVVCGAKSGCQKCTLELRTENKNLRSHHDKCCPWYDASQPVIQASQTKQKGPADQTQRTPPPNCLTKETTKPAPGYVNNTSLRSITPSPALIAARVPQPLPKFISEFNSQAVDNDLGPTLHGSKWLPCANPWGKIGQEEGDVVIISPFQSENSAELISTLHLGLHGDPPKRFTFKPMERNSPYLDSHRSPERGGYSVLRLTRDRAALVPWGFTVRNHEFGGACLVNSVEPLSPAENAVSGLLNTCTAIYTTLRSNKFQSLDLFSKIYLDGRVQLSHLLA